MQPFVRRWQTGRTSATMLVVALFTVGSFMLMGLLPTGFVPADDLSQTQVTLQLPPGSNFEQTRKTAEEARILVQRNPHVKMVYTAIGGGAAGSDPFAAGGVP